MWPHFSRASHGSDMLLLGRDPKCCSFLSTVGSSCTQCRCFILCSACLFITFHSFITIVNICLNTCSIDINEKIVIINEKSVASIQALSLSQSIQSIFNICKHIRHEQTNVDNTLIWLSGYCPEIIWERYFSKAAHIKGKVTYNTIKRKVDQKWKFSHYLFRFYISISNKSPST